MRYRVVAPYRAADAEPLSAAAGERLTFERRESEWPGWLWCSAESGRSGWVPESWVEVDQGGWCELTRDYDATELTVSAGDTLWVDRLEAGWAWARRESGGRGWVPLANLEPE